MKTSDKILIGLIVLVFTIPLLFAYSLKNKIKKGEYTVEKRKDPDFHSGTFTAFKVVKVVGPGPEFLRCNFKVSNNMNYSYASSSFQKIEVSNSNDTLIIKYAPTNKDLTDFVVNVNLPAFETLIVDGAAIILDPVITDGNLNVTLKNRGVIRDGTKPKDKTAQVKQITAGKKEVIAQAPVTIKASHRQPGAGKSKRPDAESGINIRDMLISKLLYRI